MPSTRQNILWVDDEIDLLRPHVLYLESKGYQVTPVANGFDALDLISKQSFDVVLLDENMPGMAGLDVLAGIQERQPGLPVIMITKSEEENIMDEALGQRITDYLIKPVNPSQIFLACKKLFESRDLERDVTVRDYVRQMGADLGGPPGEKTWDAWSQRYLESVRWDLQLDAVSEESLAQTHDSHMQELNRQFGRFIEANYRGWIEQAPGGRPLLSPDVIPLRVVPRMRDGQRVALIVLDCLRLDEWLSFESLLPGDIRRERELYCSILPSATVYARNALFSGLFPRDIAKQFPSFWEEVQQSEMGMNRFEDELLQSLLQRHRVHTGGARYRKIVRREDADDLTRQMGSFADQQLVALVFTFVDSFTHGRSRDAIIAEFAQDLPGMRAHLRTWFERSVALQAIREMLRQNRIVIVTTDHGSIQVRRPGIVRADRATSRGVRFKFGRAPNVEEEHAVRVREPGSFGLPEGGLLKTYIFAREDYFFVYGSKRHEHERLLRGSFQHGGISMDELVVPIVTLFPPGAQAGSGSGA